MNYYNENDPKAAAWLRELIRSGAIPPGDVDTRSIAEVQSSDLNGYTQHHFFAGIGGWSLALNLAGWPADVPVWTGSCPCQPFSAAGKQLGVADARHLWPVFHRLIRERRPPVVFGEQVASKAGREWLAGVFADLEALAYQRAAADLCAAGVSAPHIRQRLFWVADAGHERAGRAAAPGQAQGGRSFGDASGCGIRGGLADADRQGRGQLGAARLHERGQPGDDAARRGAADGLANALGLGQRGRDERGLGAGGQQVAQQKDRAHPANESGHRGEDVGGLDDADGCAWVPFDIVPCRDGKTRRIEPGTGALAHGLPRGVVPGGDPGLPGYAQNTGEARVMRLRGYGNAIVPPLAAQFIRAYLLCSQP